MPEGEVVYHHAHDDNSPDASSRTELRAERTTAATITGGSSLEAIGGGAAVVLAIIALAGYLPAYLTAIATIGIGGALLAHGAAVAARWNDTVARVHDETERVELVGGMSSEVLGGAAGIALGIIALANVLPMVLIPVATIVLGGSILLAAPEQPELARLARDPERKVERVTYRGVEATSGGMALAGAGAVVLGILGVIHVGPALALSAVAMLGVGGALLLAGGALTARFARSLQHAH
ncbi:MAG: hypothetical protein ACM31C_31535 [Acidobacteriota bacterium]